MLFPPESESYLPLAPTHLPLLNFSLPHFFINDDASGFITYVFPLVNQSVSFFNEKLQYGFTLEVFNVVIYNWVASVNNSYLFCLGRDLKH